MFADLRHIIRSCCIPAFLYLLLSGLPARSQEVKDSATAVADTVVIKSDTVADGSAAFAYGDSAVVRGTKKQEANEEPVRLRRLPDSVVRRYKKEKEFAYANDPSYWKRPDVQVERPNAFQSWLARILRSSVFKWIIYLVLGGVLLFAIYRIISENNLTGFYRSPAKLQAPGGGQDPVDEDIDEKLRLAMQAGDHRSAVRYLYLGTLRQLRDKEWIQYHMENTNQEYVRQLSNLPEGASFRWLTGAYERVWYGEFPLGPDQFGRLHQYFVEFNKSVATS